MHDSFEGQDYTETYYLPLKHYFGGRVLLQIPKEQATYSDVATYETYAPFLNSKYVAFDLVDLLDYSLLLSDFREGSLLANSGRSQDCESAILSAQIGLIDAKISMDQITIKPQEEYQGKYQKLLVEADFSRLYEIVNKAVQGCGQDIEILTLDDIEFYRDVQNLLIKVNGKTKYIISLDSRAFGEKEISPRTEILSLNSKRVSFVMAADVCKSRPTVLTSKTETWPLAEFPTPPPDSISLCGAVAAAYMEGQAPLNRTLYFHSIASYVESFSRSQGELPYQREIIDFMSDINPEAGQALRDGEMYYSIIEESCTEFSVESCQVYQILINSS